MLKVKFWRIENVVLMKILEQGNEIIREYGYLGSYGDISLYSRVNPEINKDRIYVRGCDTRRDNDVSVATFLTVEEAKTALSKYIHAISEYNRTHAETAKPEPDDDIETIIAE